MCPTHTHKYLISIRKYMELLLKHIRKRPYADLLIFHSTIFPGNRASCEFCKSILASLYRNLTIFLYINHLYPVLSLLFSISWEHIFLELKHFLIQLFKNLFSLNKVLNKEMISTKVWWNFKKLFDTPRSCNFYLMKFLKFPFNYRFIKILRVF